MCLPTPKYKAQPPGVESLAVQSVAARSDRTIYRNRWTCGQTSFAVFAELREVSGRQRTVLSARDCEGNGCIPSLSTMLQPFEDVICTEFIPVIAGQPAPNDVIRALLTLLVRLGGIGHIDPAKTADAEYESSVRLIAQLVALIVAHEKSLGDFHAQQYSIR